MDWWARKTFTTGLSPGENRQTALRAGKYIPSAYGTSPRESMSLDFRIVSLPYKSSSFATPEGEVLATLRLTMLMR